MRNHARFTRNSTLCRSSQGGLTVTLRRHALLGIFTVRRFSWSAGSEHRWPKDTSAADKSVHFDCETVSVVTTKPVPTTVLHRRSAYPHAFPHVVAPSPLKAKASVRTPEGRRRGHRRAVHAGNLRQLERNAKHELVLPVRRGIGVANSDPAPGTACYGLSVAVQVQTLLRLAPVKLIRAGGRNSSFKSQ